MHMADALLSPAVGGATLAGAAGLIAYSARRVTAEGDEQRAPLMGVMGAFVFAAQMINFAIPATGSSGHLGGGLLLAVVLGPHAAFLTIASVLVVQALLFADGGLLALGCNILNLGLFPAFVCYPLIYRRLAPPDAGPGRVLTASLLAGVAGLQLGAFAVVVETVLSGRTELPFGHFVLLMQPIHLAIGVVEGLATAAVVAFVRQTRPEVLVAAAGGRPPGPVRPGRLVAAVAALAVVAGGVLSWFASGDPDGLEWALRGVTGSEELQAPAGGVHGELARVQEGTAVMPDYAWPGGAEPAPGSGPDAAAVADAGTSAAGLLGSAVTLALVMCVGLLVRVLSRRARPR
ncbi:MAG: energy-coupling factor ABC transporter permease, partial [Candidatus Latescibacterota bacterium]